LSAKALILFQQGKDNEALSCADKVLETNPVDETALHVKVNILLMREE